GATPGRHHHGLPLRLGDHATRRGDAGDARRAVRAPGRLRAQDTGSALRVRVHRRGAGPRGHHRGRRRRRAPAGDDRVQDHPAGAGRSGPVQGAQRPRLAPVDRADAGRDPGGDPRDRAGRRDQRGAPRRGHRRQQAPGGAGSAAAVPRRADGTRPGSPGPGGGGVKVGVLGAGQLGRMLALAGYPLGLRFRFLDPNPESPAAALGEFIAADYDDPDALRRFAEGLDVATYEFENVPASVADYLAGHVPAVHPHYAALAVSQDRLSEKQLFRRLGIPTAPFAAVDSEDDLARAVDEVGLPAVLKTRRYGYDGKGQFVLREAADVHRAWAALGGAPLILEGFVAFERELSIIAVRGRDGDIVYYPLSENHHLEGILRRTIAPAPGVTASLQARAEASARAVLEEFDYVGVLAIELFQRGDDLLANEMAPRVHNSGHWTIEGAETSQF